MSIRIATSRFYPGISRAVRSHHGGIKRCTHQKKPSFRCKSSTTTANASAPKQQATTTTGSNGSKVASESTATAEASSSESVPIGSTFVAMTLAIASVAGAAALAENATASMVPKFDPKSQRFDQSTFFGRVSKMLLACDPSLLFYSGEEVSRCKAMVDDYENQLANLPDGVSESEMSRKLWEAQRISNAALHPDTGDTIPHPFRMSGYVPFNGPICVAMVASQSTSALLFWSWVNQSQNALVNFYNRNAASEMTNETLAISYAAAVGSSLAVAFGLATFIQKKYSPAQAKNLLKWVAFPSAIVASSLNCYIVRSPEIDTGIPLVDKDGNDVLPNETSKIAAERGVNSTTLSRAILQAPVYFLPPLLMGILPPVKNMIMRNPMMRVPVTTYLLLVCFGVGLPCSVAIFPQMGEIKPDEAEEKYHGLKDEKNGGKPYDVLYYNKGL